MAVAVTLVKVLVAVSTTINVVLVVVEVLIIAMLLNGKFIVDVRLYIWKFGMAPARDLLVDALVGAILSVLPGTGIDMLADVNTNTSEVVTALGFAMLTPLEEFSR